MSPEGVQGLINKSAERGWEAMLVAFFCVFVVGLLVWLMRQWSKEAHDREERMAKRIDELESFARTTLLQVVQDTNKAMAALTAALGGRPCLLKPEESNLLVRLVAKEIKDQLKADE